MKVETVCLYHLRKLRQFLRLVGQQEASALVLSRLDYCNSVLTGLPQSTIALPQRVQNAAAGFVCDLK